MVAIALAKHIAGKTQGWKLLPIGSLVLVLAAGLPIISLLIAAFGAVPSGNSGLLARMLPIALRDTGWLMLQVGIATGTIGLLAAWLVAHFDFPGRRLLDWGLVLPLAIPTYLSAYAWVEFLDFTGPIQTGVRMLTGASSIRDYWFPEIQTPAGAALVMSLVLYPYVYLSCRAFFLMQSGSMTAASRVLGAGAYRTFFTIALPLSRPAIVVGVTLALMEVLNDLGAVQYFGVNSLTAVIYSTWLNRANFAGAAQLAVTIVLIVGILIWAEQHEAKRRRYLGHRDSQTPPPLERLYGWRAFAASAACTTLLALGFGVPVFELVSLSAKYLMAGRSVAGILPALFNTLTLAFMGALVCVVIGLYSARHFNSKRTGRSAKGMLRIATLGYALPGTVLALGLTAPLGLLDGWLNDFTRATLDWMPGLIISGSFFALVYAYSIRFLAVSHNTLDAAIKRRGPSLLDAAQVLGAHGWRLAFRVDLPTLTPAIISAATLVFVECVKELPATLLLRPLGVETLATLVYQQASAEVFTSAALPALAIVLAGLVPVVLASHLSGRRRVN